MAKIKISKEYRREIAGISGILIGLYMIFILNNNRGLIPIGLGIIIFSLRKYKW